MKKAFRVSLIGLGVLLATGFLTRWLLTDLRMQADLPESFWLWLGDVFGVQNTDYEQQALEVWVGLSFSFIVVSLLTLVGWFLWRRIKTR